VTGGVRRQAPKWSEVRELVQFERPGVGDAHRVGRAATIAQLREIARRRTPRGAFDYVDGAADQEVSLARARAAYAELEFRPRVLRDVSDIDLGTSIMGQPAPLPLVLAPTGFTRMMHWEGEYAVGRAAAAAGLPYGLSTVGTTAPERLAEAVPDGRHWFQLYIWRDREASRDLVQRAAAAGFEALVLTVDTPISGHRLRDTRNGFTVPPRLTGRTFLDMTRHPSWWLHLLTSEPLTFASLPHREGLLAEKVNSVFDPSATVADLAWLRGIWPGPLIVKGVQTADDAQLIVEAGADAVVVSNHGGRQLDRAPTPLRELPAVLDRVGGQAEVFVDTGIMTGADIIAAVALGARAALVGRAYLYGLMAGGEAGVTRAITILREEMVRTMRLLGVTSVKELDPSCIRLG
jgi:L-lactate dehydrogenase (cytochrome)